MALDVSSLFPAITPFSGGAAGFLGGVAAGTAVNNAQLMQNNQDQANQMQAIDLQNKQADQPNVALDRQLKGLTTQGNIDNVPDAIAAQKSALQANLAKSTLDATDSDLKEQYNRFSAVAALDAHINSKDFDPGDMDQQREANRLAAVGHPDHKWQLFGKEDQARVAAAAPTAHNAMAELKNTMELKAKLAEGAQKVQGAQSVTDTTVAGELAKTQMQGRTAIDVELIKAMATGGAAAIQASQAFMALPEDRQITAAAAYEKTTNTDHAISPATFNKIVELKKSKLTENPEYKAASSNADKQSEAWQAMDLPDAKKAIVKAGVMSPEAADQYFSKKALGDNAALVLKNRAAETIATRQAKAEYPKVDDSVQPFDPIAQNAAMRQQGVANNMVNNGAQSPPSGRVPTSAAADAPSLPQGVTPPFPGAVYAGMKLNPQTNKMEHAFYPKGTQPPAAPAQAVPDQSVGPPSSAAPTPQNFGTGTAGTDSVLAKVLASRGQGQATAAPNQPPDPSRPWMPAGDIQAEKMNSPAFIQLDKLIREEGMKGDKADPKLLAAYIAAKKKMLGQ